MLIPFGTRLKELREAHGYTQCELAKRSGLKRTTIAQFEHRVHVGVRAETLRRLAHAFGMSMDELAAGTSLGGVDAEVNGDAPASPCD